jgi:hypothetical protein
VAPPFDRHGCDTGVKSVVNHQGRAWGVGTGEDMHYRNALRGGYDASSSSCGYVSGIDRLIQMRYGEYKWNAEPDRWIQWSRQLVLRYITTNTLTGDTSDLTSP